MKVNFFSQKVTGTIRVYVLLGLLHFFFRQHESEAFFLPTLSMTKMSIYNLLLAPDKQKNRCPPLCLAYNTHWVQLQQKKTLATDIISELGKKCFNGRAKGPGSINAVF